MEQSRLPNQTYRMLVNLDEDGKLLGNGDTRTPLKNWLLLCMVTARRWRRQIIFVCLQAKIVRHVHPGVDC